jgi:hypothetical protein
MSVYTGIILVLTTYFFIHKTFLLKWQAIENSDPSIICTFLKAWKVSNWFMKAVFVSSVYTMYIQIRLKKIFVIYDETN